MRKHGYPKIMKALKGRKSIEEGIAFMQSHEIVVQPRCENAIHEFMNYSYRVDPITDEVTNVLEDKNNHVLDSLRYALEAVRRTIKSKKVPEFTPLPSQNFWGK